MFQSEDVIAGSHFFKESLTLSFDNSFGIGLNCSVSSSSGTILCVCVQLSRDCKVEVQRILHQRALDVKLDPELQKRCMTDLGKWCSEKTDTGQVTLTQFLLFLPSGGCVSAPWWLFGSLQRLILHQSVFAYNENSSETSNLETI